MKNTVVIPVYNRPEYLKICIDFIKKSHGYENYRYLFACDIGYSKKNYEIIDKFDVEKYIVTPNNHKYRIGKQSFNVINGLLSACTFDSDLIFYIEDDVFIGSDFFDFSEQIHKKENGLFCSILSKNVNGNDVVCGDINAYYVKQSNEYQGIGACFNKEMLKHYLSQHFVNEYFSNLSLYVSIHFSDSSLHNEFAEQDGLIRRIIEKNKLSVAFSHIPRCFHAGFYGYHRSPKIQINRMNFEQRCAAIMKIAFDVNELSAIAQNDGLVSDSLPVNLNTQFSECYKKNLEK